MGIDQLQTVHEDMKLKFDNMKICMKKNFFKYNNILIKFVFISNISTTDYLPQLILLFSQSFINILYTFNKYNFASYYR